MVDVRELLKYNQEVRHRYFESLTELSWDEFTKNREASFHSIRNIFIHTLNAVDYWLSFLQKEEYKPHPKFDEYMTFEDVRKYLEHVEKLVSKYLEILSNEKMTKRPLPQPDRSEEILVKTKHGRGRDD